MFAILLPINDRSLLVKRAFSIIFGISETQRKEGDPMSNEISVLVMGMGNVENAARQPSL
jgi:hypothetical protein